MLPSIKILGLSALKKTLMPLFAVIPPSRRSTYRPLKKNHHARNLKIKRRLTGSIV